MIKFVRAYMRATAAAVAGIAAAMYHNPVLSPRLAFILIFLLAMAAFAWSLADDLDR